MNIFYKEIVKGLINEFSNGNYRKVVKKGQKFDLRLNENLVLEFNRKEGDIFIVQANTETNKYVRPIMNIHVDSTTLHVVTLSNTEEFPELKYVQNTVYNICSTHQ